MYRFAAFQLDPQTHELRKSGVPVKIQEQSFVVLLKLLEASGKAGAARRTSYRPLARRHFR